MYSKKKISEKIKKLSECTKDFLKIKNKELVKRIKETDISDGFLFKLLYSQKYKSHDDITIQLNKFKKTSIRRSSYEERLKLIDCDFLESYYKFISGKIDELFYKNNNRQSVIPIIAYDGTESTMYSSVENLPVKKNKGKSNATALSMGFFNVSYNDPVMIKLLDHKNERKGSIEMINTMTNNEPSIYCSDRGFYSLKHFDSIAKTKNYFVCRVRKNCLSIDNTKIDYTVDVNGEFLKKIRFVNYNIKGNNYYLASNLPITLFQTDDIINIYHKRWNIEEYFKYIKNNMKMDQLKEKQWDTLRATIFTNFIISKIVYLIFNLFEKKLIKDNNHTLNKTRITKDLFSSLIVRFIYNEKLSKRFLIEFFRSSIIIITTNRGKLFNRISIFPYTKWYIKGYHNKYVTEEV